MRKGKPANWLASAAIVALLGAGSAAAAEVEWGYHGSIGAEFWGTLEDADGNIAFPRCAAGTSQSPIDIDDAEENEDLTAIAFDYHATPLKIINNSHTVEVEYEPGSSITVGGKTFGLLQFHFHIPSEHDLEGSTFPMEGHLVHARGSGDNVELAVVGVLIEEGDFSDFIAPIFDNMPAAEGEVEVELEEVDATDLLPEDREEYFAYSGSLTTPPCSEGVNWFVLNESIEVSPAQIDQFGALFFGNDDFPLGNARPVQPLNGREVSEADD